MYLHTCALCTAAQGAELRATLSCDNGLAVTCLAVHGKGFLAGQDGGVVTVFERDDKEGYRRVRAFAIQGQSGKIRWGAGAGTMHCRCVLMLARAG